MGVSTFGNLRIEAYLQLPAAYRSLSRPSSAPDAKAFTLRSYSLELLSFNIWFSILNCLSFFLNISFRDYIVRIEKVSLSFVHFFHLSVKLFFYPLLLERPIISYLSSISVRFYSNLHIQMYVIFLLFDCQRSRQVLLGMPNLPVRLVGLDGLEPSTSRLSGVRSNHLSYRPLLFMVFVRPSVCQPR